MTHTKLTKLTKLTLLLSSLTVVACAQAPVATQTTPTAIAPTQPSEPATPRLDRGDVRAALAVNRLAQMNRLRAYSNAGVFPKNREQPGLLNIFIDDEGAICAAANLMAKDGLLALVQDTAKADNYLRLATVTDGPLMDWMLGSGLTQDEVDAIQEPYMGEFGEPDEPFDPQVAAATEVSRLRAHFTVVLAELEKNFNASLDAATNRLLAENPTLVASL